MKIIDFRVRPPLRGILKTAMYANAPRRDRFIHQLGMQPAPSASKRSMPMLLKEMKKAGVVRGVMARISDVLGSISNEDVHAICKAHPKQFVGIAGVDPTSRKAAIKSIDDSMKAGFRSIGPSSPARIRCRCMPTTGGFTRYMLTSKTAKFPSSS